MKKIVVSVLSISFCVASSAFALNFNNQTGHSVKLTNQTNVKTYQIPSGTSSSSKFSDWKTGFNHIPVSLACKTIGTSLQAFSKNNGSWFNLPGNKNATLTMTKEGECEYGTGNQPWAPVNPASHNIPWTPISPASGDQPWKPINPVTPSDSSGFPYRTLNVGEDYLKFGSLDNNQPRLMASQFLDGKAATLSASADLKPYLQVKDGVLYYAKNITTQKQFDDLKSACLANKTCELQNNDPNKLVFHPTIGGKTLPFIINNGLRGKSVGELISDRINAADGSINESGKYYIEISAKPGDFANATGVVALNHYFYMPQDTNVTYSFNGYKVAGVEGERNPIVLIKGINNAAPYNYSGHLWIQDGKLYAKDLTEPGIYQINVKATSGSESAYQTFYINVSASNQYGFSGWQQGHVATTNVLGRFGSTYMYFSNDPEKTGDKAGWDNDVESYAQDMQNINQNLIQGQTKLTTALPELMDMDYTTHTGGWTVSDAQGDVDSTALTNARHDLPSWLPQMLAKFKQAGVEVAMNFYVENRPRAAFSTYNAQQQQYFADAIVNPLLPYADINGVSLDLEGGFNQPNAANFYKLLSDKLAYHGKWFSFYYFSNMFTPQVMASFGPMGVALISAYDVTSLRAPETTSTNGQLSYVDQGFSTDEAKTLYQDVFANDNTCDYPVIQDGSVVSSRRASWCGSSVNDAVSENSRLWNAKVENSTASPKQVMASFNGKYQVVLPLAATSSQMQDNEVWAPDFAKLTSGSVMSNNAKCSIVTNAYLKQNQGNLDGDSAAAKTLQACLFADVKVGSVPVQSYQACGTQDGKAIPYYKCIKVSNLPGSVDGAAPSRVSQVDYMKADAKFYGDTDQFVGYGAFALENPSAASSGCYTDSTTNKTCQSPWYVGWHSEYKDKDPAYSSTQATEVWQEYGRLLNQ